MVAWLLASIERLSPSWRRIVVGAVALALLAAALTALTLEAPPSAPKRSVSAATRTRRHSDPNRTPPAAVSRPVSATGLRRVRAVARQFLVSYLRVLYGRAWAGAIIAVTPELRRQLSLGRALVTPVERSRDPHLVALQLVGTTPGFAVATATVNDTGVVLYRLRFSLQEQRGRWLVVDAEEG
jgi:hypothetical protein